MNMDVMVEINRQSGEAWIAFPDRARGGVRIKVEELTMLDLVQLQGAIDRAIKGLSE